MLRLCVRFKYASFYLRLQSFQSLFESISVDYKTLELNYFVFEKHVTKRTSNTNTRTLRLCVCFKRIRFLLSPFSLVSLAVWIYFNRLQNTAPLELNYFVFETFYLLPFLASMSRPQGPFSIHFILFYGGGFFVQAAVGSFGLTTRLSFSNKWSNFINIKQLSDS